jgi:hypothetical protein
MLDEIRHARGCFELARRHADADMGPGPLPLDGALEPTDLAAVVLGTIAGGCIGETIAALEAAEVLAYTEGPAARRLLEQIAREEATHAQLAGRFLAWALQTGPASLRGQVERIFRAELAVIAEPVESPDPALDAELLRHGLLPPSLRQALRVRALHDVVAPCTTSSHRVQRRCSTPRAAATQRQLTQRSSR